MILKIENLRKSYKKIEVLKGIDLEIKESEIFGILGPNGAGKTTTLKIILGLTQFDDGKVEVLGSAPQDPKIKEYIGFLPEEFCIPGFLKVKEALNFYSKIKRADSDLDFFIEEFCLKPILNKPLGDLSQGQKRLIQIIVSLLGKNKLLIWDEPTVFLDLPTRKKVLRILEERFKQTTMIISSHILSEIEKLCDRVCFIKEGKILKMLTKTELKEFESLESAFEKIENV